MTFLKTTLVAASTSIFASASLAASSDILFVLDGSGSMWGQIEGEAKIATAKSALSGLMDNVPAEARLGLMTYGTKSKESCTDVVLLNGLGTDRATIKKSISGITPLGKTPIHTSLMQGISVLGSSEPTDTQKSLVLISDGIETCDGNPCDVAATAQASGVNMKIHVVGFDVDAEARAQLECIANRGGGQYFDASDTSGFQTALQEAVVLAQATVEEDVTPEPEGPKVTEFFRDDFDGDDLSDSWIVTNPDPESYIVEDGVLLMLSTSASPFEDETGTNLITYAGEMPDGDWDAIISFTGEMSASGNALNFGLRKDTKNALAARFLAANYGSCYATYAQTRKLSKGEAESVHAVHRTSSIAHCGRNPFNNVDPAIIKGDVETKTTHLTLSKRGRSYFSSMTVDGVDLPEGDAYVVTTGQFTSLRGPGELSFAIGRFSHNYQNPTGEALFMIDSIVINAVEE